MSLAIPCSTTPATERHTNNLNRIVPKLVDSLQQLTPLTSLTSLSLKCKFSFFNINSVETEQQLLITCLHREIVVLLALSLILNTLNLLRKGQSMGNLGMFD